MDRTDLDIPESTVWPESDAAPQAPVASPERLEEEGVDHGNRGSREASPATGSEAADASGEQSPSLDPDSDDTDRAPKI